MKIWNNTDTFRTILSVALLFAVLCACAPLDGVPATTSPQSSVPPTATPSPRAEIVFGVTLPAPLLPDEVLLLSVLDEVTGLAINQLMYSMQSVDSVHYTLTLPFPMYSVVKYRYLRKGDLPILEDDPSGQAVRYRMFHVTGPGGVEDVVASWSDTPFAGATGRITGQVKDSSNGAPIPNILVTAGGMQTLTDSLGTFYLEGLPPGIQNVVAYAMDGFFLTFQQGAEVIAGGWTPVDISLTPAQSVSVIFIVTPPKGTIQTAPLRLAGNLLQLGNTFTDLRGGISTVASRMPVLTALPDGRYSVTLNLPVGADVHYKYTLGDGFWNAEQSSKDDFLLRQMIVPPSDIMVTDTIEKWETRNSAPILFEVSVPENTPYGDVVSLQINPYGWMEPLPMWPLGNNRWAYQLFNPLNLITSFEYRYCRNDQCGSADDVETSENQPGRPGITTLAPQNLRDTVTSWKWLPATSPTPVVGTSVLPREAGFIAGVEFQTDYHPTWQAWIPQALQNIQAIGANWVLLTPSWTVSDSSPLVFSPVPGVDPLWSDVSQMVSWARAINLNAALFPTPQPGFSTQDWWTSSAHDSGWWVTWFEHYRRFMLYYADLAAQTGAGMLVLGGDWVGPSLPGGQLAKGGGSGVPADAEARWRQLIAEIRQHYNGRLYWAVQYPGGLSSVPDFLESLDGFYLLWGASLSNASTPSVEDMQAEAGRLLDRDVLPLQQTWDKPVVLAIACPSVNGAATGCLADGEGGCLHWTALNRPDPSNPSFQPNLQTQLDVYLAMLNAINTRSWVTGFISRGYYPPAALQDISASIHGKPASDALWYWFPRLTVVP